MIDFFLQLYMHILQYMQVNIFGQHIQTIFYFFKVGFKNINAFIGKEIFSFRINCS